MIKIALYEPNLYKGCFLDKIVAWYSRILVHMIDDLIKLYPEIVGYDDSNVGICIWGVQQSRFCLGTAYYGNSAYYNFHWHYVQKFHLGQSTISVQDINICYSYLEDYSLNAIFFDKELLYMVWRVITKCLVPTVLAFHTIWLSVLIRIFS